MFNENDLKLYEYNDALISLVQSPKRTDLLLVLKKWFDTPELRPDRPEATFADYCREKPKLAKSELIHRLTKLDWSRGLYACQIAQLHATKINGRKQLEWRVITLSNNEENIKLHLELETIRNAMELVLSSFFTSYIYAFQDTETDMFIFIMSIAPKDTVEMDISNMMFSYMVYFPGTEYVVVPKYVWNKEKDGFFKESLLSTFGASSLNMDTMEAAPLNQIKQAIENRKSLGVLRQLRKNQLDKTPLDIRQKRQRGFDQSYVDGGEQKKRIVPIDMEEMKARYEALDENFGWDEVDGFKSLEVNLDLPLNTGQENSLLEYEDDKIEISMVIEGSNVAEGVRKSIISGKINTPAPVWLEAIAVTGIRKIIVNADGVVEEKEDEIIPDAT